MTVDSEGRKSYMKPSRAVFGCATVGSNLRIGYEGALA
jgi:hypothetical protein